MEKNEPMLVDESVFPRIHGCVIYNVVTFRSGLTPRRYSQSVPFKLIVGPDEDEFYVPSALLAYQSKPLSSLVNNGMQESRERCWRLEKDRTFVIRKFIQFMFTGNYDGHWEYFRLERRKTAGRGHPQTRQESANARPSHETRNSSLSKTQRLWEEFKCLYGKGQLYAQWFDDKDEDEAGDTCRMLLGHADMYEFADRWGVDPLCRMSLSKMKEALATISHSEDNMKAIAELIWHVFENTPANEDEPLREVVVKYAACQSAELWQCPEFRQLTDMPEFSQALLSQLLPMDF